MEGLEESCCFSIQETLINQMARSISKQREEQILARLKELDITFESEQEKFNFAKTRLSIITNINKPKYKELYLDGKTLVASWWETIDFESDGARYTAICGNPQT